MQQQTLVPQDLSALMQIDMGLNKGTVAAQTPQGNPTVAAQLASAAQQQMMPPAMQQVIQQAGLAGQIENMRRQQMMQQMQQMAARQMQGAPIDQGIAAAPGAGTVRMAEGGIAGVPGYAGGTMASDPGGLGVAETAAAGTERGVTTEELLDKIRRGALTSTSYASDVLTSPINLIRNLTTHGGVSMTPFMDVIRREAAAEQARSEARKDAGSFEGTKEDWRTTQAAPSGPVPSASSREAVGSMEGFEKPKEKAPAAPSKAAPTGSAAAKTSGIEALFERERKELGEIKTKPASMAEIAAKFAQEDPAYRQLLISQGIDPDALIKRIAEDKALFESQRELLRKRMEREEGKDTFLGRMGEALRGFRQLKGQGIGAGLLASEEALSRRVGASEAAMDQMRDAEIKINELEITRRRALEDQRRAVFEGRLDKVAAAEATRQNAENEIKRLQAKTYTPQAQAMLEERKIAEMAAGRLSGQQAQEFARLQGIASAHESRKAVELRKLDEDFAKQNATLLNLEKFSGLKPEQKKELETARFAHERQKAVVAKDYDDRINMINARLYPGIDFSSKSAAPSGSASIDAARKIVSGG